MARWSDTQLAYLAGILDGEGYIGLVAQGNIMRPKVVVKMSTAPVIEWLHTVFGASVWETKTPYGINQNWEMNKVAEIEELLEAVLPYMILKREHVELLLAFSKTSKYPGSRVCPEVRAIRENMYVALRLLNEKRKRLTLTAEATIESPVVESEVV